MCSSEHELIHDVRQVHLEELIMKNEEQFVMVPVRLSEEELSLVGAIVAHDWGIIIQHVGTPIPPCADVETVDLSEYMPEYHDQGMGCGLEDRGITDRYEAMGYGWDQALERVCSELPEMVRYTDMEAQVAKVAAEKDAEIARLKEILSLFAQYENLMDAGADTPAMAAYAIFSQTVAKTLNEGSAA
ncbi:hypothetical protein [Komagataeibacter sp. SM21]|uniref:hypothetical protein n=1 Tax=Komagataeibacter sp. SM21 TaxID=3242899 RepID=UPI00352984A7